MRCKRNTKVIYISQERCGLQVSSACGLVTLSRPSNIWLTRLLADGCLSSSLDKDAGIFLDLRKTLVHLPGVSRVELRGGQEAVQVLRVHGLVQSHVSLPGPHDVHLIIGR